MTRFSLVFAVMIPVCLTTACGLVTKAADPLDAYTLTPVPVGQGQSSSRHLVVELPTANGALDTDRILIKPSALQAEYLPKGRWVDPAPELIQSLLVASLQNTGSFRLVGRDGAGLVPDYVLLTDLNAFEAEAPPPGTKTTLVRVGLTLTLLREGDRALLATRRFEQQALAGDAGTLTLVAAFDAATRLVLADAVAWTLRTAR